MMNEYKKPNPRCTLFKDHQGNIFPSLRAMCRYWGQKYTTVADRLEHGWSVEEALTRKPKNKRKGNGIVINKKSYASHAEACRALGLNINTFHTYLYYLRMRPEDVINKMLVSKMRREKKKEVLK